MGCNQLIQKEESTNLDKQIHLKFIQFQQIKLKVMSKIQHLAILSLILLSIQSLRVDEAHLAYTDSQSYLKGLKDQQTGFEKQVKNLNENLDKTLSSSDAATDILAKIKILEGGILTQEDQIFATSKTIIPKLVLKDQCQNLTQANKDDIIKKCDTTITHVNQLLTKLKAMKEDARIIELKASANNQIYYLKTIKQVLQVNCTTTAVLSATQYQTNINSNNWITGDQTMQDIVNQYIQRSKTAESVTNCGLDAPFYFENKCQNCSDSAKPYFDMKKQQCVNCPNGQTINSQTRACEGTSTPVQPTTPKNATNPQAPNTIGKVPAPQAGETACPDSQPYVLDTGKCGSCSKTEPYFDLSTKKCVSCTGDKAYNATSKACQTTAAPPVKYTTNPNASNTIGSVPAQLGAGETACPDATPYFSSKSNKCIACNTTNPYFNVQTQQCVNCPNGEVYNATSKQCFSSAPAKPNASNPKAPNTIGTITSKSTDVPCPLDTPYYSKTSGCINCSAGQLFDLVKQACVQCQAGKAYNASTHSCDSTVKGVNVTNSESNRTIGFPENVVPPNLSCPADKPFSQNGKCIDCTGTTPYFSIENSTCVGCPIDTMYDQTTRKCFPFVSKLNDTKWISNFPFKDFQETSERIANNTAKECPKDKPFFNRTQCISCNDKEHFNLQKRTCETCSNGTIYFDYKHKCWWNETSSQPKTTLYTTSNIITPMSIAQIQQQQQNANKSKQCKEDKPYFNGIQCTSCPNPYNYFSIDLDDCVYCPKNSTYVAKDRNCQDENGYPAYPSLDKTSASLFVHQTLRNLHRHELDASHSSQ